MTRGRTLLVSGIGKRNHLLRLIAAECAAHEVALLGADASALAPGRAELDRFELLPLARDPAFGARYVEVLRAHDVTACLTIVDPEIPVIATLAEDGTLGDTRFLHPGRESALACEDKFAFHEVLRDHGVATVPTFLAPPAPPYIRKDRAGSAASGFLVVERGLDGEAPSVAAVYQPYLTGQHYCVDAYFSWSSGDLVDCCVKEILVKTDGETYLMRSFPRDDFVELVRGVAEVLPLRGIVNLDVYDVGGRLAVMEVNCRIGGNYPASHALGVNLLRWAILEGVDGATAPESFSEYAAGLLVSKYIGFSDPYRPT